MPIKTNHELVSALIDVACNHNTLYVLGCFGAPLKGANITRYCNNIAYNKQPSRTAMIKAAESKVPPVYGFDCVCLIKGLLWGWCADPTKTYGGATYASNSVPDIGADQMIKVCKDVSTDFAKIEPGEAVWMSGHIGVYIGDGKAVECTPAFDNKVQITAVKNIGTVSGLSSRIWTKHGKLPYIQYQPKQSDTTLIAPDVPTDTVEPERVTDDTSDKPSKWFVDSGAHAWAQTNSIINGNGTGNYGYKDTVTKEMVAQMLYNYSQIGGI